MDNYRVKEMLLLFDKEIAFARDLEDHSVEVLRGLRDEFVVLFGNE